MIYKTLRVNGEICWIAGSIYIVSMRDEYLSIAIKVKIGAQKRDA
jgi:hypothetical protein